MNKKRFILWVAFPLFFTGFTDLRAADDFNPPAWVDTDQNGKRDNLDPHFLKAGESMVIGVNPDWKPPAFSTSYHWHWFATQPAFRDQGYFDEYDSFESGTWYLPDHQNNLWTQENGEWKEAKPPPMTRNWGDFDPTALLVNPRWEGEHVGEAIPEGAPRGRMTNGVPGLIWNRKDPNQPFTGVFEVPLYADLEMPKTLVRLQYGGGFQNGTYWDTQLEGFDGEDVVPVKRVFRSPIDGTIFHEDWEFEGSPDRIRLSIDFKETSVDQVLIDTIAVPEPKNLGMLLLGGGVLFAHRLKRMFQPFYRADT